MPQFSELPKDSRTLLKTPTTSIVKNISGGIYHHFGIKEEIEELVEVHQNIPTVLTLLVGIDGLPIYKNPSSELWPILGQFTNISSRRSKVFIIGAYCGKSKPKDSNEFLEDFVKEIKIFNDGVMIKGNKIKVSLQAVICDAPAKAFVFNIRGHTGKHSCQRCHSIGKWGYNRVYFPDIDSNLRTHEEFISYSDNEFHVKHTIMANIPNFNLVLDIPFDYMHCICIGVMKKLLLFWIGLPKHKESLPSNLINVIDEKLLNLSKYIPNEFQRKHNSRIHPLRDANRWKATELRQCLLYTGIIAFKNVLSKDTYNNFLALSIAIRILLKKNVTNEYNNYAKQLLIYFVTSFKYIYGEMFMSHNIHSTLHLADDAKQFGSLNYTSAFPYENFMQPLKKKIKTGMKPLQQLTRRYAERRAFYNYEKSNPDELKSIYGPINTHCKQIFRPVIDDSCLPHYSGWKTTDGLILKIDGANNCVEMINGNIVEIENIATRKSDKSIIIIGRCYENLNYFFNNPCSSLIIGIRKVNQLGHLQVWKISQVKAKLVRLPIDNYSSIIIPFVHDL